MNPTIYFFGSGDAFFWGAGFLIASMIALAFATRRWLRGIAIIGGLVGGVLIAFSAIPLPYWWYAALGIAIIVWLAAERIAADRFPRGRAIARLIIAAVIVAGIALELPYHFWSSPTIDATAPITIIGDSIAAGMGDNEADTWPRLLAQSFAVDDRSKMGATAKSAFHQADDLRDGGLVLLEIGGNDLLGSTTVADYEHHLHALLERVSDKNRTLVMFELPLPPLTNEFGRVQRRLAERYQVKLIPRRVLITVLTTAGATRDGIHLTRVGHRQMADVVARLFHTDRS